MPLMILITPSRGASHFFTKSALRRHPSFPYFQFSGRDGNRSAGASVWRTLTIIHNGPAANDHTAILRGGCAANHFPPVRAILSSRYGSDNRSIIPEKPTRDVR